MARCAVLLGLVLVACAASAATASAAINKQINFQGRLTDASGLAVPDGTYNVEFKLHNHATTSGDGQGLCTGSCLWRETRTGASKVTVTRGLFSVQLGEVATLTSFNFDQDQLYLSIRAGGTAVTPVWDAEMTPRQRLGAAPQAIYSDNAGLLGGQAASYYTTAANLTGTLADARLSSNVALRNVNNNFSVGQTITGTLTATDLTCSDCLNVGDLAPSSVGSSEIVDASVLVGDLAFDPATQVELDTHKSSTDHDGRYYTEAELNSVGIINTAANPLDWSKLKNVPAGLADGSDDGGAPSGAAGGDLGGTFPNPTVTKASGVFTVNGTGKTAIALPDTGTTTGLTIGADTNLYRSGANQLTTDGQFRAVPAAAGNSAFFSKLAADTTYRWTATADGGMYWGTGTGVSDTRLYRSGVGVLRTDTTLSVGADAAVGGNLGVGDETPDYKLDVAGRAAIDHDDGFGAALSVGKSTTDYTGSTGWAATWNSNILLTGLDSSSISFHDAGARVDTIRVGAGTINLGENVGWGAAATRTHGNLNASAGLTVGSSFSAPGLVNNADIASVGWGKLTSVPAGFADGTDDGGAPSGAAGGDLSGTYPNPTVTKSTGAFNVGTNLSFSGANPYISAASYFIAPGGAYFNSGTVYTEARIQARGGIGSDNTANLVLAGGTSGHTSVSGGLYVNTGVGHPSASEWMLTPSSDGNNWAGIRVIRNRSTVSDGMYIGYGGSSSGAGTAPVRIYADGGTGTPTGEFNSAGLNVTGDVSYGSSGTRTLPKDNAGAIGGKSGFYETAAPTNYYNGASGWQHLIEARHSNTGANYAMQIAGSLSDQEFYGRKTAGSATSPWRKFLMSPQMVGGESGPVPIGGTGIFVATCPAGTVAISGGFQSGSSQIHPFESILFQDANGITNRWRGQFRNSGSSVQNVWTYVYCA